MFVICANTVEEAERDLEAMKLAYESGKPIGCDGDTITDVEQAMGCLRNTLSADGTYPRCYDDKDDLWKDEEETRLRDYEEEDFCGCCTHCDEECVNRQEEEKVEITNPNYKKANEDIAKLCKIFGLDEPNEKDIYKVFENVAAILDNWRTKFDLEF